MTGLHVLTMDRTQALAYQPSADNEICISIRSPGAPQPELGQKFQAVLYLAFHDAEAEHEALRDMSGESIVSISHQQVSDVLDFLLAHPTASTLIVHCEAGISRSVSLAAAIVDAVNIRAPNNTVYARAAAHFHAHRNHLHFGQLGRRGPARGPRPWRPR